MHYRVQQNVVLVPKVHIKIAKGSYHANLALLVIFAGIDHHLCKRLALNLTTSFPGFFLYARTWRKKIRNEVVKYPFHCKTSPHQATQFKPFKLFATSSRYFMID